MTDDPLDRLLKALSARTRPPADFERRFWTRLAATPLPCAAGPRRWPTGWRVTLPLGAAGLLIALVSGFTATAVGAPPAAGGLEAWIVPMAVSAPSTVLGG